MPSPKADSQGESEIAIARTASPDANPLDDLAFRESCDRLMASLPRDQRAVFDSKSDFEKRLLVGAWEEQQGDVAEDERPVYTHRRSKV